MNWPDESKMPEPYRSIKNLPMDEHGWFFNGPFIKDLILSRKIHTIIEIGSWLGLSTRFMARLLPHDGKIYAVDTWQGSIEHQSDPRLATLYQTFLSNVKHAELTDIIIPFRMSSLEASKALNIQADMIYIDGSHEEEDVYDDIMAWAPHLNPKGVICGDDWNVEGVRNAVSQCAITLKKEIRYFDMFWMYE
jgi:predicted O-methyltransferase YrrM